MIQSFPHKRDEKKYKNDYMQNLMLQIKIADKMTLIQDGNSTIPLFISLTWIEPKRRLVRTRWQHGWAIKSKFLAL